MKCQFPSCHKKTAQYFICWNVDVPFHLQTEHYSDIKGCGMVCAHHDKVIGRTNLIKSGMTLDDAILWETTNRNQIEGGKSERS